MANPAVVPAGISVRNAASLLAAFSAVEEHEFWPDDLSTIAQTFHDSLRLIQGHNQLTDRYLLALAAARGGVLATFDRTVGAGLPANSPLLAHLEIIPV